MRKFLMLLIVCCGCCSEPYTPELEPPAPAEGDSGIYLHPGKGLRFGVELAPGFYLDQNGQISPGFEL